jgi:hypothetical protein
VSLAPQREILRRAQTIGGAPASGGLEPSVENLTCSVQPHDVQPALTPRGDEYNEHVGALDALLGLNGRTVERSEHQIEPVAYDEVLTFTDPTFGEGPVDVAGPRVPLHLGQDPAHPIATFHDGRPAVTRHETQHSGTAIAYAFYPGHLYWWSPDPPPEVGRDPRRLPRGWVTKERRLAVAPAVLAGTPEAGPSQPRVGRGMPAGL